MAKVRVDVTLKPSLLDSAGRTVAESLRNLGFDEVKDVRIGKTILLDVAQPDDERIRAMCAQLLANPVIEDYNIQIIE